MKVSASARNLLCCLVLGTQWMQLEGSSEEGVQQCVSALSFVYFCHAIFESEQSKKEV